jgi:hypothetical protein
MLSLSGINRIIIVIGTGFFGTDGDDAMLCRIT